MAQWNGSGRISIQGLEQPEINESTPLLRHELPVYEEDQSKSIGHTAESDGISEINNSHALDLARVSSIPQGIDIGPDLERIPPATSTTARKELSDDLETGYKPTTATSDESRFINVTPARFWLIFSGIQMGFAIGYFDWTLMASSHPVITSYFNASNSASWLSTAFLLMSTAFMPLFGRISDTFGRRPVYLFSITLFFFSTLWCAVAQSIGSFIAARAVCGLGAGGVFSMGMIICSDLVRLEYRGVYQSYINLTLGAGGCLGIAFGGYLCDQLGWRGAFVIQLPYLFVYLLVAAWTTPADLGLPVQKEEQRGMTLPQLINSIDLTGSFILMVGVTALIMGLNLGGNVLSWRHPLVFCSLILSGVLAVIFLRYEKHVARPVMPVELLLKNPHASLIFASFFGAMSIQTVIFNAPLFFQAAKLESPTESGLRLVASTVAVTLSSVGTGFLITWTRRLKPTIIIGTITLMVGGCAATSMGASLPDLFAMICLSLTSLGQGFAQPSLTVAALAVSEQEKQAVVTTTLMLWRNLGSVMGIAISSWILQNTLIFKLGQIVTDPDKERTIELVRKSIRSIAGLDPLHRPQGL
ncbi:hypothetical protein Egran_04019 [Elaphomyces granulatus]|uniref:Major facilitator superfamily (MFS) profile domain-containing protein n=1 Tax=Elaphomyces granulatus TaxID=519963 RepID=A0A232LVS0_9EURO|nr:hypothetical protein Egran_04019 [Elaphomyces granulatus]